ncbi:MAG TPA: ATP-binding cassette domain-containing protein [Bacteroidia bacterium]|nr:ATP-binding cassette domain-containing protein [Bacteroidia bacterium]HNT80422.1 ATP-binding cassette domain-containing protein [Bacteroidia bacterium]
MIGLELHNLTKKFNRNILFKNLSCQFEYNSTTAICGNNGSGKSTLLQIIAGYKKQTEGQIYYRFSDNNTEPYSHVTLAAPYLDLYDEFTMREMVEFYFKFKKPLIFDREEIMQIGKFQSTQYDRLIKHFSSGMKQRLKLLLAFSSDTPLLLLDEPVSNLDETSILWFDQMIKDYTTNRMVIICTNNHPAELSISNSQLNLSDFK